MISYREGERGYRIERERGDTPNPLHVYGGYSLDDGVSCRRFARKFRESVLIVSGRIPERDRTRISRNGGR
jgi:hypothetical protein